VPSAAALPLIAEHSSWDELVQNNAVHIDEEEFFINKIKTFIQLKKFKNFRKM
jgi:hypothetical protein